MKAYRFSIAAEFNIYDRSRDREIKNNSSPGACGANDSARNNFALQFHFGSNPTVKLHTSTSLPFRARQQSNPDLSEDPALMHYDRSVSTGQ
jgi:hypothetical protein